jgi:hypothetical protein
VIDRTPVTEGFMALLAELTGFPVEQRTVPIDPATGKPVPPPYTIVDPLDFITDDNTLADRHAAAIDTYQATFVSGPDPTVADSRGGGQQSQLLADRGRRVIERPANGAPGYKHPLDVGDGVGCYRREAREAGGTSDANDAIITSVIRYRLFLAEEPA